jgi:DNA modification methylase
MRGRPSSNSMAVSTAARLAVIYHPIESLKPNAKNPRRHDRRQIKKLAHSIRVFGFVVPVLIDRDRNILAGHGRVIAAKEAGLSELPTIQLEHLSEAQARAFMIADNRLSEIAEWDDQLLAETFKDLTALNLDFSIEATGFSISEIDLRIAALAPTPEGEKDPADTLPPDRGPPVSALGDLWLLGDHRVYCGNALEEAAYVTLMQGEKAAMAFTDPPYNVPIKGHASGLGAAHHREFAMASGEMTAAEFKTFLTRACSLLAGNSVDGALHYVCMDWRHMAEVLAAGQVAYSEIKNLCVWVKDNGGMGSLYRSQHELVFVFKHGRGAHRNNVQLGQHGRYRTNVWRYAGANTFSRGGEEGNLLSLHPTVKPVALVADAILDCSARRDIVLDAFLGSGTTVIAAERTGRRCYGLELDPLYIDTIIRRWQAFTGVTACHAVTGQKFGQKQGV